VDLAKMPVEDVTVEWPEALSPYVTVAKVRLPQQDISGDACQEQMDAISITPWRVTEEHRPLGNIMRAQRGVPAVFDPSSRAESSAPSRTQGPG
jgi:hypothetical protein